MDYIAQGSATEELTHEQLELLVDELLVRLGSLKRVLLIPPDHTRSHSYAGELTSMLYHRLSKNAEIKILPALGTHSPMTSGQIAAMFQDIPLDRFLVHNWRTDLHKLGEVPADFIDGITGKRLRYPIHCEINRTLLEGKWDRIISIGQVVPHEVVGMANHSKNVFVGTGGSDTIHKTHYVGAVCGMENVMGRAQSPVREILNYMSTYFGASLPLVYLLTVRGHNSHGALVTRGVFAGDDETCFAKAAQLSQEVNLDLLDEPLQKVVVYLAPDEFKSTWLGNKAIYRTRMAMANDGELMIIAPGVREFGEDSGIDHLIRKYGYHGTEHTLQAVEKNSDLGSNLAAAAHLIHGSSEGRFRVTYCPGKLSRAEIEGVGFSYANCDELLKRYSPARLRDGINFLPGGEQVFFISNPALGLWGLKSQFSRAMAGV
ncbi:MAG: lactate racemase domain-containing protein [Candidatus Sumerlaeaceae bacterium]